MYLVPLNTESVLFVQKVSLQNLVFPAIYKFLLVSNIGNGMFGCFCSIIFPTDSYWQWRTDRGAKGRNAPPGKLNVKTGPPLVDILILSIL